MPVERLARPEPPRGLKRWLFQAPKHLYRLGLGWMLGERFMLIGHRGRRSGKAHETVVEIIGKEPAPRSYLAVSAWGESAEWYQNLQRDPGPFIVVGRRQYPVAVSRLDPDAAGRALLAYGRRHPGTLVALARFMGYRISRAEEDFQALGEQLVVVRFQVEEPAAAGAG